MRTTILLGAGTLILVLVYWLFVSARPDEDGGERSARDDGRTATGGSVEGGLAGKSTKRVARGGPSKIGYAGPHSLAEWTVGGEEGAWEYEAGVLTARKAGSIAREIQFPEQARLGFDLQWRGEPRMRVILFSDDGEASKPRNCYEMEVQGEHVILRKRYLREGERGSRIMWRRKVAAFAGREAVRVEIMIDREAGSFGLSINGEPSPLVSTDIIPVDRDPGTGEFGNWLHFVSDENYLYRLSDIRVEPWVGEGSGE